MDNQWVNQLAGVARALTQFVVPLLVTWGIVNQTSADTLTPEVMHIIDLFFGTSGILATVMAIWSWFSNRSVAVAKQVASNEGVKVIVDHNASESLKEIAKDPSIPNVQMKSN